MIKLLVLAVAATCALTSAQNLLPRPTAGLKPTGPGLSGGTCRMACKKGQACVKGACRSIPELKTTGKPEIQIQTKPKPTNGAPTGKPTKPAPEPTPGAKCDAETFTPWTKSIKHCGATVVAMKCTCALSQVLCAKAALAACKDDDKCKAVRCKDGTLCKDGECVAKPVATTCPTKPLAKGASCIFRNDKQEPVNWAKCCDKDLRCQEFKGLSTGGNIKSTCQVAELTPTKAPPVAECRMACKDGQKCVLGRCMAATQKGCDSLLARNKLEARKLESKRRACTGKGRREALSKPGAKPDVSKPGVKPGVSKPGGVPGPTKPSVVNPTAVAKPSARPACKDKDLLAAIAENKKEYDSLAAKCAKAPTPTEVDSGKSDGDGKCKGYVVDIRRAVAEAQGQLKECKDKVAAYIKTGKKIDEKEACAGATDASDKATAKAADIKTKCPIAGAVDADAEKKKAADAGKAAKERYDELKAKLAKCKDDDNIDCGDVRDAIAGLKSGRAKDAEKAKVTAEGALEAATARYKEAQAALATCKKAHGANPISGGTKGGKVGVKPTKAAPAKPTAVVKPTDGGRARRAAKPSATASGKPVASKKGPSAQAFFASSSRPCSKEIAALVNAKRAVDKAGAIAKTREAEKEKADTDELAEAAAAAVAAAEKLLEECAENCEELQAAFDEAKAAMEEYLSQQATAESATAAAQSALGSLVEYVYSDEDGAVDEAGATTNVPGNGTSTAATTAPGNDVTNNIRTDTAEGLQLVVDAAQKLHDDCVAASGADNCAASAAALERAKTAQTDFNEDSSASAVTSGFAAVLAACAAALA